MTQNAIYTNIKHDYLSQLEVNKVKDVLVYHREPECWEETRYNQSKGNWNTYSFLLNKSWHF